MKMLSPRFTGGFFIKVKTGGMTRQLVISPVLTLLELFLHLQVTPRTERRN